MTEFQVGDRVQVMKIEEDDFGDLQEYIGEYGYIIYVPRDIDDGYYLVDFDDLDDSEFYGRELELAE
jgi:hypothetical protein